MCYSYKRDTTGSHVMIELSGYLCLFAPGVRGFADVLLTLDDDAPALMIAGVTIPLDQATADHLRSLCQTTGSTPPECPASPLPPDSPTRPSASAWSTP